MECFSQISDLQKKREDVEYAIWESKELSKTNTDQTIKRLTENDLNVKDIQEQIDTINLSINNLQNARTLESKYEIFKVQTEDKIRMMYEAVE